ncbi:sortase [Vagococcus luciliae]|uniref:Sortase n=1 Tax=Vagococcus luciliae TaxID=2920380 RepID=A0ABY5NY79_9ENTE|nr:sortase [Vagococcus luciliae]UUV98614.1 hypothetical protein G314FT_07670 [Vagococcus luciliae]
MTNKTNKIQPENLNNTKLKKKRKKKKHRQSSVHSACSTKAIKNGKVVVKKRKQITEQEIINEKKELSNKKNIKRLSVGAILIATLGLSTTAVALNHHNYHQEEPEIKQHVVTKEYKPGSLTYEKVQKNNEKNNKEEINKEEINKEEINKEEINKMEPQTNNTAVNEVQESAASQEELVQETVMEPESISVFSQEKSSGSDELHGVQIQPAMTLNILGEIIYYQNGGQIAGQSIIDANSDSEASTWGGAQIFSGNDGLNTHFIGHNPGAFSIIFSLSIGNQIVVTDSIGTSQTYVVDSICQVTDDGVDTNTGTDLYDMIAGEGGGERITLQSCINDEVNLIIFASAQ